SATRAQDGGDPAPLIRMLADFSFDADGNDRLVDLLFDHDFAKGLGFLMAPFHIGQNLSHAVEFHGGTLTGISTLARDGWQRSPFTGKVVDESVFGKPACKILVDATQAEQIASAAILHIGIEQGGGRELERLADGSQRSAHNLVTTERR